MNGDKKETIPHFLADTWWFGLTNRLNDIDFEKLARLRVQQGFTAVQIVIGIPPEVGPKNLNAFSKFGVPWDLDGKINEEYLFYAREKIKLLNDLGLLVIVYGAWGHQIEWIGVEKMKNWWNRVIKTLDDLNVVYCLTGESNLWLGQEKILLPDLSTGDLLMNQFINAKFFRLIDLAKKIKKLVTLLWCENKKNIRKRQWNEVLSHIRKLTKRQIIMHVIPGDISEDVVGNPEFLDVITIQTGHSLEERNNLWQIPLEIKENYSKKPFVNLEPWYEGIKDNFGKKDQIYAYWVTMMAGAWAYCYGAHGIWNVGDGDFLRQWGRQRFEQATDLNTPKIIGENHKLFFKEGFNNLTSVRIETKGDELVMITRSNKKGDFVSYIPNVEEKKDIPDGVFYLPVEAKFSERKPTTGQLVVISKKYRR